MSQKLIYQWAYGIAIGLALVSHGGCRSANTTPPKAPGVGQSASADNESKIQTSMTLYKKIHRGMLTSEVEAILGEPHAREGSGIRISLYPLESGRVLKIGFVDDKVRYVKIFNSDRTLHEVLVEY